MPLTTPSPVFFLPFSSDRAAERRQGINPDYDGLDGEAGASGAPSTALALADGPQPGALAPFLGGPAGRPGSGAAPAGAPATATDASKYMGGSLDRTHLVRGLDYALLARTRDELAGRKGIRRGGGGGGGEEGGEDEDEEEDEDEAVERAAAAAAARRAANAAATAAMGAVAPSAPPTASTTAIAPPAAAGVATTARGRAILAAVLPLLSPPTPPPAVAAPPAKPPLPAFGPRRTA